MRKALLTGLSALAIGAVAAAPVSAQAPTAGGSCGYEAGNYGLNSLSPIDVRNPNRGFGAPSTINRVHFQVEYSGVGAGAQVAVVRYQGSLSRGIDIDGGASAATFTSENGAGTYAGSVSVGAETGQTRDRKSTRLNSSH